jgi:hypothetical protein
MFNLFEKHIQKTIIGGLHPATIARMIGIEPQGNRDMTVQQ